MNDEAKKLLSQDIAPAVARLRNHFRDAEALLMESRLLSQEDPLKHWAFGHWCGNKIFPLDGIPHMLESIAGKSPAKVEEYVQQELRALLKMKYEKEQPYIAGGEKFTALECVRQGFENYVLFTFANGGTPILTDPQWEALEHHINEMRSGLHQIYGYIDAAERLCEPPVARGSPIHILPIHRKKIAGLAQGLYDATSKEGPACADAIYDIIYKHFKHLKTNSGGAAFKSLYGNCIGSSLQTQAGGLLEDINSPPSQEIQVLIIESLTDIGGWKEDSAPTGETHPVALERSMRELKQFIETNNAAFSVGEHSALEKHITDLKAVIQRITKYTEEANQLHGIVAPGQGPVRE